MALDLVPGAVLERYTVESVLGEGGMAVVYRVRHNQLGSPHAMKVLTVPGQSVRQRLLQEGRVQATLRHPNVVAVTDVVDVDGSPGLIMEYVEGPSLDRLLERYRPRLEEAEALAVGIISGVAFAHRHGLIHRDLKPANVLVANTDLGPVPKVADFGLAKFLSGDAANAMRQTRSGVAMGTPSYMSPEQIRDAKNVDKRTDLFSLGALLYELVAGRMCFPGGDLLTVFGAIADGRWRRFAEFDHRLPDRIVQAIEGCLAVDPAHRIPDCETLLKTWRGSERNAGLNPEWSPQILATLVTGTPAEAAQPSGAPRTWADEKASLAPSEVSLESADPASGAPPSAAVVAPVPRKRTRRVLIGAFAAGCVAAVAGVAAFTSWPSNPVPVEPSTPSPAVEALPSSAADPSAELTGEPPAVASTDPATAVAVEPSTAATTGSAPDATSGPASATPAAATPTSPPKRTVEAPAEPAAPSAARSVPEPVAASPTPAPEPAPPEPPKASPTTATVTVKGDAKSVWLEGANGRFPAGQVPPGTYTVTAFFDSGEPVSTGEITVSAGDTRTLRCSSELLVCR